MHEDIRTIRNLNNRSNFSKSNVATFLNTDSVGAIWRKEIGQHIAKISLYVDQFFFILDVDQIVLQTMANR